ncbi:MAG: RagB/SusD family nutrient uptake outer membrane protein [Tannerellaceae bacterium]|nr:RagB/SusD family nutrient uptake outer membrane protein [Tannerellaceae bacterium]
MKKYSILLIAILSGLVFSACSDLDVLPYDQITAETFYKNAIQIQAGVERPYTHANAWAAPTGQTGQWRISEMSADQLAWPQKGRHGYDGGDHGRLHYHSWTSATSDNTTWSAWRLMFWGMGFCNSTIADFELVDFNAIGLTDADKAGYIGELRALRAWHYLRLMDLYGNIPVVTQVGTPLSPPTIPRAEVFKFIEDELLEIAENMFPLTNALAGRMSKAAVYAMLVEMYLNAEIWTGTPRWDDCIKYCDKLINGDGGALNGIMQLDEDIDVTFSNNNANLSKEAIFQIAYSKSQGMWLGRGDFGSYNERDIMNTEYGGNNGIVVTPNAYHAYNPNDLRKHSWFFYGIGDGYGGYNYQGPYKDIGRKRNDYVLGTEEFTDRPIIFCYKPIKAVIEVSGSASIPVAERTITIKEWNSPEFPGDDAKLKIQEALNGSTTKALLCQNYDNNIKEVYMSGAYNGQSTELQYPWSTKNDYRYMWQDCAENTGARYNKYKTGTQTDPNYGNNHFILYRLTDIYFAKAEALMRKSGGSATQAAVDLINTVKKRAFLPDYWSSTEAETARDRYNISTLTLDELLVERGREFIFEGKRRTDLIRFEKFEFAIPGWWDGNAGYVDGSQGSINKDKSRRLFAIPGNALQANPNLKQNPGYDGL